ncbi:hypothetical protein LP419_15860 [Massilia sp. H-1]|nr:hypothetical protein LP419_15860 [Massilia sp. H-1]
MDRQALLVAAEGEPDVAGLVMAVEVVAQRVLDQRLQQQRRNLAIASAFDADLQALAVAQLLQGQVVVDEAAFVGQAHMIALAGLQGVAQQIAQMADA